MTGRDGSRLNASAAVDGDESDPPAVVAESKRATEYLANERTFLAWIRTCIGILSLGFVVAKFSLWLKEIAIQMGAPQTTPHASASLPIGIAMMALGGVLAILAAWRYHVVNRDIRHGNVRSNRNLVVFTTVMVAALCALMIFYMLVSAQNP